MYISPVLRPKTKRSFLALAKAQDRGIMGVTLLDHCMRSAARIPKEKMVSEMPSPLHHFLPVKSGLYMAMAPLWLVTVRHQDPQVKGKRFNGVIGSRHCQGWKSFGSNATFLVSSKLHVSQSTYPLLRSVCRHIQDLGQFQRQAICPSAPMKQGALTSPKLSCPSIKVCRQMARSVNQSLMVSSSPSQKYRWHSLKCG